MLNWICPECGRECSPSRRECPGCAEAADAARHSVSALGGISALARAVQGDAVGRAHEHSVAVAVLEREGGERVEVGFGGGTAGDAVGPVRAGADVEEPIAIDALVQAAQGEVPLMCEMAADAEAAAGSNYETPAIAEAAAAAALGQVCEGAEPEVGLVEQPMASNATVEVAEVAGEMAVVATSVLDAVGPVGASADGVVGIEAADVSEAVAEPIACDMAVVAEATVVDVAETAPQSLCETAAAEVGLVEAAMAIDATVEVAQAEVGLVAETAVVDAIVPVCSDGDEATWIEAASEVAEAVAEPIAQAEVGLVCDMAVVAEATGADAAPESLCETAAEVGFVEACDMTVVAEATVVDVAETAPQSLCETAAAEVGLVEAAMAIDATVEVAQAQAGLVAETAAVAEPIAQAEVGLICDTAVVAETITADVAETAPESFCETAAAEVGLVEAPIAIDATVEVAQAEAGLVAETAAVAEPAAPAEVGLVCDMAVVAEATGADVADAAPESFCETAAAEVGFVEAPIAIDATVEVGQAEVGQSAETPIAIVENETAADVADATPESVCETAVIAEDALAIEVRPTPALSDSSRLAFFEAQQIVAEDLLEIQAEQAAYSNAIRGVLESFRAAPAVTLLTSAHDVLTAPAPPLLHCAPSARPWIAAIPPKNPGGRRVVPAHEPHLAGPSLPRELQSFREAARSPFARGSKRAAIPAWAASVVAATALFLGAGTLIQKLTADRDPKPAASAAQAPSQTTAADAHPLGRFVEVTGLRVVVDLKRHSQLQYVVVNHSATPISDMALRIAVRSTASGSNDALFHVAAVVPYLGPFQSKEVRTDLDAQLQSTQIPDWDYLKADVQVTPR